MDIQFCSVCNESIPMGDLDAGRAVQREGKVICVLCETSMSVPAPPPAAQGASEEIPDFQAGRPTTDVTSAQGKEAGAAAVPPRSGGVWSALSMLLASMAIASAVGGAFFLLDRIDALQEAQAGEFERLRDRQEELATRSADSTLDVRSSLEARLESLHGQFMALDARLAEVRLAGQRELDALREDVARLNERIADLARLATEVSELRAAVGSLGELATLARLEIAANLDRIAGLEAGLPAAPAQTPSPDAPTWEVLLDDLGSQNPGDRWSAVLALGETGDPAVVEFVARMVRDPDIFVRMATARVLGDLGTMRAAPVLIGVLGDSEASVREAAVVSLRRLTGEKFSFDPEAKASDRVKRTKQWQEWWEREGEALLADENP